MRDTSNANKLVSSSVMLEHLETIFLSFSFDEIKYVIDNVYRPPISNNDDSIYELLNILFTALRGSLDKFGPQYCIFYCEKLSLRSG